jgi:N4-gp56 family major capsid protein
MATATYPGAGGFTAKAEADKFIPEIWSDEIIAAYEKSLVLANLVNRMPMAGKKGDTLHIPKPTRGDANLKSADTAVTIIANTEDEVQVAIDKHYEYSRMIEDIVDVQALSSLRQFYTTDAGYALARQVDTDLFALGKKFDELNGTNDGADYVHPHSFFMDASATVAGSLQPYAVNTVVPADVFTDAAFRDAIKRLDDNDVPMDGRFFVVPPSVVETLRGLERYVSDSFVSGRPVETGMIGSVYGIDIYVSTNCAIVETAAANSSSSVDTLSAILAHRDAMVFAEQLGVRTQTQYKQEYLGDLFTADTLYGVQVLRPEAALTIAFSK